MPSPPFLFGSHSQGKANITADTRCRAQREQIKLKAMEVEEKDLALQAKEYNAGLVATPARTVAKGHAAATVFGKEEFSEEPSSTANKFQPGSWMPTSKK
ncbi:hypothetical protein XENOCAPTIV_010876 [Xenoophorus captivus]|uniref:Uncharacterized protein n=1 Tax=Xenoophorus captivus TaxID=1517983 RepID=A0ABV0SA64_9TELE